ncbi:MAG: hypothetical protein EOP54_30420, partial [Sphingobacteriales bacterium]
DLMRSVLFILAAAAVLWAAVKQKLSEMVAVIIVGLLLVGDLFTIDRNYVNAKDFVSARQVEEPFEPTPADEFIKGDKSHYRVYEPYGRLQGRTSYYHQSVGGYSAVRPRRMDQLFTYTVEKNISTIIKSLDHEDMVLTSPYPILDLLNVKYLILQSNDGQDVPVTNPFANGPAWFVSSVKPVATPDEEFKSLEKLDSRNVAVINKTKFAEAVAKTAFTKDSTATIKLDSYEPNHLVYTSKNANEGLAVFSEMYYANGWNAYIDGKVTPHYQADYVLRALKVPAGTHKIEFKFEPQVVKTGSTITLVSFIILLGLIGAGVWYERKKTVVSGQ